MSSLYALLDGTCFRNTCGGWHLQVFLSSLTGVVYMGFCRTYSDYLGHCISVMLSSWSGMTSIPKISKFAPNGFGYWYDLCFFGMGEHRYFTLNT